MTPAATVEPEVREARRQLPIWVQSVLAAGVSGGLMAAGFQPLNLHWLAWIALVPWLVMLPKLGPDAAWLVGMLVGLVFYRIGLSWGFGISGPLAGGIILVFSVWMGFAFRVAGMLVRRFGPTAGIPSRYTGC